jgi:hypothetical protein
MGGPKPLPPIDPPVWLGSRLGERPVFLRPAPAGDGGGPRKGYLDKKKEEEAKPHIKRLDEIRKVLDRSATGREIFAFLDANRGRKIRTKEFAVRFLPGAQSYWDGTRIVIQDHLDDVKAALALAHEANHARATLDGPRADPLKMTKDVFVAAMLREEAGSVLQEIKVSQELGVSAGSIQGKYEAARQEALARLLADNPAASQEERDRVAADEGFARILKALKDGELVVSGTRERYEDKYGRDWEQWNTRGRRR